MLDVWPKPRLERARDCADLPPTTDMGEDGEDSRTFEGLAPGLYDVSETVPTGWNLESSCDNDDTPDAITPGAGDDVECTFVNTPQSGAINITKTRKHAADGSGDHPHEGVTFTITGGALAAESVAVVTDANGEACYDGLLLSQFGGDYTVTETVPAGYVAEDGAATVTVANEAGCDDGPYGGEEVDFGNIPLTEVSISVDSQVDGGTHSSIVCGLDSAGTDFDTDDVTLDLDDLQPGTYILTIVIDP